MMVFKLNSIVLRLAIGLFAVLFAAFTIFAAKWNFANSVSSRVDTKEIADIAAALGPDDPQTRYAAAVLYEKTFDPDDLAYSLSEFESTVANSPNNYLSWLALGQARGRSGDITGAESALRKALELAPNYADVQWAYGNSILRAGDVAGGFEQIRNAAAGRPQFVVPAVVTAMTHFDGDLENVQRAIGNSSSINAALSIYLVSQARFTESASVWESLPDGERSTTLKPQADLLFNALISAKQFRLARRVSRDISTDSVSQTRELTDGSFEKGVKMRGTSYFEWMIADGPEPQIAISNSQRVSGSNSLTLAFSATQTKEFRNISQNVAVEPGANYRFSSFYRSELKAVTTLRWEIVNISDGQILGKTDPFLINADWTKNETHFISPATIDGVVIRLVRADCTSSICPIAGRIWIDDVSVSRF